jgi:hypothetical protein
VQKLASGFLRKKAAPRARSEALQVTETHQENAVTYYGIVLGCVVDPNNSALGSKQKQLSALLAVTSGGSSYMPLTKAKSEDVANTLGVKPGSLIPIFVPPGQSPQAMVNDWITKPFFADNLANFAKFWWPHGSNDFKDSNLIYDAYGNFMFGATGRAAGISGEDLQDAGQIISQLKWHTPNNPVNVQDIQSGINMYDKGGVVIQIPVSWP